LDSVYAEQEWAQLRRPSADEFARLKLKRVSDRLADNSWLEGDRFTIGDLIMVTVLRLADRGRLLAGTPNLVDYVARGESRPAFKSALEDQLATFREHEPQGEPA
jgi:glutathione S-transferase